MVELSRQVDYKLEFSTCCRICASKSNSLCDIFNVKKNKISLAEMVSFCLQLPVASGDDRPSNICSKCIPNLNVAYEFCKLASVSEKKFEQWTQSTQTNEFSRPSAQFEEVLVEQELQISSIDESVKMKSEGECYGEEVEHAEDSENIDFFNEDDKNNIYSHRSLNDGTVVVENNFNDVDETPDIIIPAKSHVSNEAENLKRATCSICSASFATKQILRRHMLRHTGEQRMS